MRSTCAWLIGATAVALAVAASPGYAAPRDYSVSFIDAPEDLRGALETLSALARGERDYPTVTSLSIVARRDIKAIEKALRSAGYYAGSAQFSITEGQSEEEPKVVFTIEPGPKFSIDEYRIVYQDATGGDRPQTFAEAGVTPSGKADGAALKRDQQAFLRALWDKSYPAARIVGRRAEADLEAGMATAVFVFESGPQARFGPLVFPEDAETSPVFLEKLKTWEEGEKFKRSKLVAYRDRLSATGLFRSLDVSPGAPDESARTPITVAFEERKRRTIGAGLSYSTAEGPGGRLFFEYRNLFHRGERARVEIEGSEIEQSLNFSFDKPLPAFPGSAFAGFNFLNENTDAFDARTVAISGGLARRWLDDRLETRAGLALETSKVRTTLSEERTYFVSFPAKTIWNTEDSILNPTEGVRASLSLTPFTGSDSFTISELEARTRFRFGPDDRMTTAFRGRLGAIFGSSLADLPSNKRFFSGGGGSVRGFDFQAVGPLDATGDPIGGRSVIEGAFESRFRVAKKIEIAGFIDAGSVSSSSTPDFREDFFIGVGGGLRYMTVIGPIRLDVATPLEKRPSDRSFQIYISLGQPF